MQFLPHCEKELVQRAPKTKSNQGGTTGENEKFFGTPDYLGYDLSFSLHFLVKVDPPPTVSGLYVDNESNKNKHGF